METRRLEILLSTFVSNRTASVERAVGSIKFDAIGAKFSLPELKTDVAFGNRGIGVAIAELAVGLNVEVRRRWRDNCRSLLSRGG